MTTNKHHALSPTARDEGQEGEKAQVKITRTVRTRDGAITIKVTLDSARHPRRLTRDEVVIVADDLAASAMRAIADAPYTDAPISTLKVKP